MSEPKPVSALALAEGIARGCIEAGFEPGPIFRLTECEDPDNADCTHDNPGVCDRNVEDPDGGEVEVSFEVDIGSRSLTVTVTDDTLSNEIRQMNNL